MTPPRTLPNSPSMVTRTEMPGRGRCVVTPVPFIRPDFAATIPPRYVGSYKGGYSGGFVPTSPRTPAMDGAGASARGQSPGLAQRALSPPPPGARVSNLGERSTPCLPAAQTHGPRASQTSSAVQLPETPQSGVQRFISCRATGGSVQPLPSMVPSPPLRIATMRSPREEEKSDRDVDTLRRALEAPGNGAYAKPTVRTLSPAGAQIRSSSPMAHQAPPASPRMLVSCPVPVSRMQSLSSSTSRNQVLVHGAPPTGIESPRTMARTLVSTMVGSADAAAEIIALRRALADSEHRNEQLKSELAASQEESERHRTEASCLAGELRRLAERATQQLECTSAGDAAAGDPVTGTLQEIAAATQPLHPMSDIPEDDGVLSPRILSEPSTPIVNLLEIPEGNESLNSSRGTTPSVSVRSTTPVPSVSLTPLPSQPERKLKERKAKDEIDQRLLDFLKETGCPMKFKRVNKGFYDTEGHHVELSVISGKLMVKLEGTSVDQQWNRGKFGPIERFIAAYSYGD
eukprot:gnl/MRDRNA2_/MRDRNA2_173627_c0_seq1.p1 gnl/MRDRNA2_/MRDRNA2_173627_c0~~gnl/MRDRNA2_/MRDRNA2_173627_c0_seq1.p1  ORF type:complete len:538 (-),score=82.43 gnl/MRDRNA2_/MRDRNA2_173627_c0_seq1:15-1562(-)